MKLIALFLLIPSVSFADCALPNILSRLRPGAEWSVTGSKITWLDAVQTKPTPAQISADTTACQSEETTRAGQKAQARVTLRNTSATVAAKVQALILMNNLDR